MDIYRELIFSYLEEDNTQRVYFRVKPLLAASGDVQEEARAAWPDEGALRLLFQIAQNSTTLRIVCARWVPSA